MTEEQIKAATDLVLLGVGMTQEQADYQKAVLDWYKAGEPGTPEEEAKRALSVYKAACRRAAEAYKERCRRRRELS